LNELLLVFPDPAPPLLAQTLDLSGVRWKSVGNAAIAMQYEPVDGWTGAVVCADDDPEGAFTLLWWRNPAPSLPQISSSQSANFS
jgi:hypothetical protein